MRRLAILLAGVLGLGVLAACVPPKEPPPNPETLECEQGFTNAANFRPDVIAVAPHTCGDFSAVPCLPAPAGSWLGCYVFGSNVVLMHVGFPALGPADYSRAFSHEYCHAWDANYLDAAKRARFAELAGTYELEHYADVCAEESFELEGFYEPNLAPATVAQLKTEGLMP